MTAKRLTNSENGYAFNAKVNTLTDGTGEKVTGIQIESVAETGTGDIDFTGFETAEGYRVISLNCKKVFGKMSDCKRFIAPDVFYLIMECFNTTEADGLAEIVLSEKLAEIPKRAFQNPSIKSVTPLCFPYVKKVGWYAYCGTQVASVELPLAETMEEGVFKDSKVVSVRAPRLQSAASNLFLNCPELTEIVVGEPCVTNFTANCYANCPKLKTLQPMPIFTTDLSMSKSPLSREGQCSPDLFSHETVVIAGDAVTTIPNSFLKKIPTLVSIVVKADNLTTVADWAFQQIAPGAAVQWMGRNAPTTFGNQAFSSSDAANRVRIVIKGGNDLEGWMALSNFRAVTDADRSRADYPGKRTVGVLNNLTYLVTDSEGFAIRIR